MWKTKKERVLTEEWVVGKKRKKYWVYGTQNIVKEIYFRKNRKVKEGNKIIRIGKLKRKDLYKEWIIHYEETDDGNTMIIMGKNVH